MFSYNQQLLSFADELNRARQYQRSEMLVIDRTSLSTHKQWQHEDNNFLSRLQEAEDRDTERARMSGLLTPTSTRSSRSSVSSSTGLESPNAVGHDADQQVIWQPSRLSRIASQRKRANHRARAAKQRV